MPPDRYFLSPSVHWCTLNGRCVILDIATDRYLQVPAAVFDDLLPFVEPHYVNGHLQVAELPPQLSSAADELLLANVLHRTPSAVQRRPRPFLPRPSTLVARAGRKIATAKALSALPYFLKACATADYCLRRVSLNHICLRVTQRRAKFASSESAINKDKAIQLVELFNLLRPFYPRNYLCLFDCCALTDFLANWHVFPYWVFGVTLDPFQAHCWIQTTEVVLSDTINFSSRWYSPIMVI